MFGKRRELMSQEPQESNQEKVTPNLSRSVKKEVELFPPIAERNQSAAPAAGVLGSRLSTQISMFRPLSFDEALDIVEALRSRHATTISLEKLKKADAGRLVDFVAGASAALDGDFHKMTEQVFVFCPANIKLITTEKSSPTIASKALSSSSFSLDTLFPEIGQDKHGFSSLWSH